MSKRDDVALVRQALALVQDIESDREAGRVLGVAPKTVKEWRAGTIPPMRSPMRQKLISKLDEGSTGGGAAQESASTWHLAELAAARRAEALVEAARAVRIEAEAARARAEAFAPVGRALEKESDRAERAQPQGVGPRYSIRDLIGPDADMFLAALKDLAEEARIRRGEATAAPAVPLAG